MRDILDEYGTLIIASVAAIAVIGIIVALFWGSGNNLVAEYLNNSI